MQNIWLFQARAKDYDLTKELQIGRKDDWELVQHRNDVNEGDAVILWQSGDNAGIYGFGKLRSKLGVDRIYIEYTERLDPPLLKKTLLADPVLGKLLILRQAFGANPFSVKADEWSALSKMRETANGRA